jgi:GxxExxY protein
MAQIVGGLPEKIRDPQTYAIIGAAMEVHRELGAGFLEPAYQEALAVELSARDVPYEREVDIPIVYKGVSLGLHYRPDFVCYGGVLVELKALSHLTTIEDAQVINYLAASRLGRGLLLNFGAPSLQFKRFVRSALLPRSPSA